MGVFFWHLTQLPCWHNSVGKQVFKHFTLSGSWLIIIEVAIHIPPLPTRTHRHFPNSSLPKAPTNAHSVAPSTKMVLVNHTPYSLLQALSPWMLSDAHDNMDRDIILTRRPAILHNRKNPLNSWNSLRNLFIAATLTNNCEALYPLPLDLSRLHVSALSGGLVNPFTRTF